MAMNERSRLLSSGAQFGSYQDLISKSPYSTSLGTEIAILQRKIYLPLLPLERMSYGVLKAYDYLQENELLMDSEFHPRGYWTADDVYADFYEGNFYIPMLFPQLEEAGVEASKLESTIVQYNAVELPFKGGELGTDGYYNKANFIKLLIPRYIAMQFRSTIPAKSEFTVNFIGGNSQPSQIIITGLKSIGEYDDPWLEREIGHYPGLYEEEEQLAELADIIMNNLDAIEEEENSRLEEMLEFEEKENEHLHPEEV